MRRIPEPERFFKKVKKVPGGCWEWQARCNPGPAGGYGVFYGYDHERKEKRIMGAHRWSYIYHYGPIPEGKIVMHTCDNRKCVNPKHLRAGTLMENAQDMVKKGRWRGAAGEDHFRTTLTATQIETIRNKYSKGKIFQHQLAKEFGVSQSTIARIVRGEVWVHASGPTGPGRPHRGERHHAAKLTSEQIWEIHSKYRKGGITQRQLAEEYHVSAKHIGEIIRGNKRRDE